MHQVLLWRSLQSFPIFEAELYGGNLRKIKESISKILEINAKNKIIYIEESGERPEEIRFMLTHLNNSNWFNSAKGIIFGNINDNEVIPFPKFNSNRLLVLHAYQFY